MKATVVLIAVFIFLFYSSLVKSVFAVPPSITAFPSGTVSLDTAFTVTATMSGLSKSATYRLRIAIAQPETFNYFGSTYDGTTWHMGSIADGNFVNITTDAIGVWGGDIQGKIDSDDPNFTTGSGTYDLKIGRYTQTGITPTWSNLVSITIAVPPTPTPTNTPTPTSPPTATPTPTKIPTPTPVPNTPTSKPSLAPLPTSILGKSTQSGSIVFPTKTKLKKNVLISSKTKNPNTNLQKILMFVGIVFILSCTILTFQRFKKNKLKQDE